MALTHTTRFGTPLRQLPSFADTLEAGGLHRLDPRFDFALRAVKAAPAAKRAAVFERFLVPAPDVPLPAHDGICEADLMLPSQIKDLAALCGVLAKGSWAVALETLRRGLLNSDRKVNAPVEIAVITLILRRFEAARIESLTHAWLLGVCANPSWRAASREWLAPYTDTYLPEWLADKPDLADFAEHARCVFSDVPSWMSRQPHGAF